MARRPRLFAAGVLYHVIVRGNQRRKTFTAESDYRGYIERLARYRKKYDYVLHAYCLMPNHVHLLVESSEQPLAKFMQGLQQSYSQYFNKRHGKSGHVFEGRYKAIICQKDPYLLELIRYIHLNPVRAGIVKSPERYRYSGDYAYLQGQGQRNYRSSESPFHVGRNPSLSKVRSRGFTGRTQGGVLRRGGPAIFGCRGLWRKDAEEGAGPVAQNVEAAVYRNGGKRAGEAAGT
jgi:REP element-mobilizing transposase RayT